MDHRNLKYFFQINGVLTKQLKLTVTIFSSHYNSSLRWSFNDIGNRSKVPKKSQGYRQNENLVDSGGSGMDNIVQTYYIDIFTKGNHI